MESEQSFNKKEIPKSLENPDPTTYSPVSLNAAELRFRGYSTSGKSLEIFKNDKDRFYRLRDFNSPQTQYFVAKILKGIMNISDVVTDDHGNYYSKELQLDDIEHRSNDHEIEADILLLASVFGDFDHQVIEKPGYPANLRKLWGKVAYYDFVLAERFNSELHKKISFEGMTNEVSEILFHKLDLLKERLSGKDGESFLQAIGRSAHVTIASGFPTYEGLDDDTARKTFQKDICNRIEQLQVELTERKSHNVV